MLVLLHFFSTRGFVCSVHLSVCLAYILVVVLFGMCREVGDIRIVFWVFVTAQTCKLDVISAMLSR